MCSSVLGHGYSTLAPAHCTIVWSVHSRTEGSPIFVEKANCSFTVLLALNIVLLLQAAASAITQGAKVSSASITMVPGIETLYVSPLILVCDVTVFLVSSFELVHSI